MHRCIILIDSITKIKIHKKAMQKVKNSNQVARSRADVKANYDRLSNWYDLVAGSTEKKFRDLGLRKLNLSSGEVVLEIGYATGQCLLPLAQAAGSSGKVYGIDISEGMVKVAKTRLIKAGVSERVDLICGDAIALPYTQNSVHAIFISFTLELFGPSEIPSVLAECHRVLVPGGRICVVAMGIREETNLMARLYHWGHKRFPKVIDCRPIHTQRVLADAGFLVTEASKLSMYALPVDIVLGRTSKQ